MHRPVLLLCLLAFALLGALPHIFFRDGRRNIRWWATAAPFLADAALLLAALAGVLAPLPLGATAHEVLACVAVPLVAVAIGLIGGTIGVHRVPLSLWHQDDDAPASIVTHGPYARVRHPFYAAFILMLIGTAAALPHPATVALLVIGTIQLHRTARREEHRLLASDFGSEYAAYMRRTGRFVPRVRRSAVASPGTRDVAAAALRDSADAVRPDVVGQLAARADLEFPEDVAEVSADRAR